MAIAGWLLGVAIMGGQGGAHEAFCIYFTDASTGNLQRARLDGTGSELVIRCKPGKLGLAPTLPSEKSRGQLHLGGLPSSGGYTVVDASAPRALSIGSAPTTEGPMKFIDESRGRWAATVVSAKAAAEPGHFHSHPTSYALRNGSKQITFRPSTGDSAILAVFPTVAIVRDGARILRWDLDANTQKVIAASTSAAVWPRDLRQKARFKPICKGSYQRKICEWTMKDPDDFVAKPEYLKRSNPRTPR